MGTVVRSFVEGINVEQLLYQPLKNKRSFPKREEEVGSRVVYKCDQEDSQADEGGGQKANF